MIDFTQICDLNLSDQICVKNYVKNMCNISINLQFHILQNQPQNQAYYHKVDRKCNIVIFHSALKQKIQVISDLILHCHYTIYKTK